MKTAYSPVSRFLPCLILAGLSYASTVQGQVQQTQGNLFYNNSTGSAIIDNRGQYVSFTAPETTTATSASGFFLNVPTAPSVTFELQASDGSGNQTVALGTGTITSPVAGWNTVSFSSPAALTGGQVYNLVAQPVTSGTAVWKLLSPTSTTNSQPFGTLDANFGRGNVAVSGTLGPLTRGNTTPYIITTTGSRSLGEPYSTAAFVNAATSTLIPAQRFQFVQPVAGEDAFSSVTLRLNIAGTLPANDLSIVLLNDSNTVLERGTLAVSSLIANATNDYTVNFSGNTILTSGSSYRLALYTPGSAANSVKWAGESVDLTGAPTSYETATYQGASGYGFTYTNTNFTGQNAAQLNLDYVFSYTTAIPEPGSLALGLIGLVLVSPLLRRKALAAIRA